MSLLLNENEIQPLTRDWLISLPAEHGLLHLFRNFPRILNKLALHWAKPANAADYLTDLLLADTSTRAGFPPGALSELIGLQAYLHELHPELTRVGLWDQVTCGEADLEEPVIADGIPNNPETWRVAD